MQISNSRLLFILNFVFGTLLYAFLSKDFYHYDGFSLLAVLFRMFVFSLAFSIFFLYLYLFKNTPHIKRQISTNLLIAIFSIVLVYFSIDRLGGYLASGWHSIAALTLLLFIPGIFLIVNYVNNIFLSQNKETTGINKNLSTTLIVIAIFSILIWTNSFIKSIDQENLQNIPGRTGYSLTYEQAIEQCNDLTLGKNKQECLMQTRASSGIDCELIDQESDPYNYYKNTCLTKKGMNEKDVSVCDSITEFNVKEECLFQVISIKNDWANLPITYCDKLSTNRRSECIRIIAGWKKDPLLCKRLESTKEINECFYWLAVSWEVEGACDLITGETKITFSKEDCVYRVESQRKMRESQN